MSALPPRDTGSSAPKNPALPIVKAGSSLERPSEASAWLSTGCVGLLPPEVARVLRPQPAQCRSLTMWPTPSSTSQFASEDVSPSRRLRSSWTTERRSAMASLEAWAEALAHASCAGATARSRRISSAAARSSTVASAVAALTVSLTSAMTDSRMRTSKSRRMATVLGSCWNSETASLSASRASSASLRRTTASAASARLRAASAATVRPLMASIRRFRSSSMEMRTPLAASSRGVDNGSTGQAAEAEELGMRTASEAEEEALAWDMEKRAGLHQSAWYIIEASSRSSTLGMCVSDEQAESK
mmetsp:Transcript_30029/g.94070  ORF Transcript_30029/g.94070 Transcript_30029/m.94070 type:complete len:302 (+) Transcript_30029:334-1239(+)